MNDWILLCVVGILTIPTLLILIVECFTDRITYSEIIVAYDCPDVVSD
jgi:hypothetical protein